jgi:hypothetical protein
MVSLGKFGTQMPEEIIITDRGGTSRPNQTMQRTAGRSEFSRNATSAFEPAAMLALASGS